MSTDRRYTDMQIERVLCEASELAAFEAKATPADRERLAELREESRQYLDEVGVHKQVVAISEGLRAGGPATPLRGWFRIAPVAIVCAAVLVFLLMRKSDVPSSDLVAAVDPPVGEGPDSIAKGTQTAPRLKVHVATESGSRALMAEERLPPSAQLRFEVLHASAGFVAIVAIDSAGVASVYYPAEGTMAAVYDPARPQLPGAIEMDETPGTETFYAAFSQSPFDAQEVVADLASGKTLATSIQVVSLRFSK